LKCLKIGRIRYNWTGATSDVAFSLVTSPEYFFSVVASVLSPGRAAVHRSAKSWPASNRLLRTLTTYVVARFALTYRSAWADPRENSLPDFACQLMILEGVITTVSLTGELNIAPMGPLVDEYGNPIEVRPFRSATTYSNLRAVGEGVLHITDDVLLLARAAIGRLDPPAVFPAQRVRGQVLRDACRYYEFRVTGIDDSGERARFMVETLHVGRLRDFFGFNRAKHAVVEAAILATRVALLPAAEIAAQFDRLAPLVAKTGGAQERRAFDLLDDFVRHGHESRCK
jgi:hypothetical protein